MPILFTRFSAIALLAGIGAFAIGCGEDLPQNATQRSPIDMFETGQAWQCPRTEATPPLTFVIRGIHSVEEIYGSPNGDPKADYLVGIAVFAPDGSNEYLNIKGGFFPIADYALAACRPQPLDVVPELPAGVEKAYKDWRLAKGHFTVSVPELYTMVVLAAKEAFQ